MVSPPIWGEKNGGVLNMRMQVILDSSFARPGSAPRGGTWVNFCWISAAGLSEPLTPHYSLFRGQLLNPS